MLRSFMSCFDLFSTHHLPHHHNRFTKEPFRSPHTVSLFFVIFSVPELWQDSVWRLPNHSCQSKDIQFYQWLYLGHHNCYLTKCHAQNTNCSTWMPNLLHLVDPFHFICYLQDVPSPLTSALPLLGFIPFRPNSVNTPLCFQDDKTKIPNCNINNKCNSLSQGIY